MNEHFSEEIQLGNEERWGKTILGVLILCGPFIVGLCCAATAYAKSPFVREVVGATFRTFSGQ